MGKLSKIFVHLGVHKTGTTSIQAFMMKNKDALLSAGIFLPKSGCVDAENFQNNHNLAWEMLGIPNFNASLGTCEDLVEELKCAPTEVAVLSAEDLEFLTLEQIQEFAGRLGQRSLKALVYLRRHDELAVSEYCHQLREAVTSLTFADWWDLNLGDPRYEYWQLIQNWEKAGFEVIVRPYDARCRDIKDLCLDFASQLGVPGKAAASLSVVSGMNSRFSAPVALMLQEITSLVKSEYDIEATASEFNHFVWWHLQKLLPNTPEFWPLTEADQTSILQKFEDDYVHIERDYASGGRIFSRELRPDSSVTATSHVSAKQRAEVLTVIIGAMWSERLRKQITATK
jgi:hypothetical protein